MHILTTTSRAESTPESGRTRHVQLHHAGPGPERAERAPGGADGAGHAHPEESAAGPVLFVSASDADLRVAAHELRANRLREDVGVKHFGGQSSEV